MKWVTCPDRFSQGGDLEEKKVMGTYQEGTVTLKEKTEMLSTGNSGCKFWLSHSIDVTLERF